MNFYKECLEGELSFETVKGSPMESHWPKEVQNNILHLSLVSNGITILGTDMTDPNGLTGGNNITVAFVCTTEEEIKLYFQRLSKDGKVKYTLHDFYNGKIGGIIDKYGVNWF